jgi:hypothetical protein
VRVLFLTGYAHTQSVIESGAFPRLVELLI